MYRNGGLFHNNFVLCCDFRDFTEADGSEKWFVTRSEMKWFWLEQMVVCVRENA